MASTSQSNEASKRLLILQIEDNRADAELALLELSNAGFEVSSDVVDTLADVASHLAAKSYDVVLADYRLPGWVGTDALKIVRQHQADVPFILVSGTLGDETAVECVKNGVTDFVLKVRPCAKRDGGKRIEISKSGGGIARRDFRSP